MEQIIVEPLLGKQLDQLAGQAILCDSEGRALGFFSPLAERPPVKELHLEPHLSITETEELRKHREGKPLAEILARLGIE
ncbi:MAG TPA: hypothetical protein VGM76_04940 [Lacipirellulaceae bacterium]|jgi:hypothetical protein